MLCWFLVQLWRAQMLLKRKNVVSSIVKESKNINSIINFRFVYWSKRSHQLLVFWRFTANTKPEYRVIFARVDGIHVYLSTPIIIFILIRQITETHVDDWDWLHSRKYKLTWNLIDWRVKGWLFPSGLLVLEQTVTRLSHESSRHCGQ